MDEATKQKVMIGVLVVAVGGILAINFWPKGNTASTDEGIAPTRKVREPVEEPTQEFQIRRESAPQEEAAQESRRRRPSEDEGSASTRRKSAPKAEQETIVPAA